MQPKSQHFIKRSHAAIHDPQLQTALKNLKTGFVDKRRKAIDAISNFDELKAHAQGVKQHALENLDHYLTCFEQEVNSQGGQVHWAQKVDDLNHTVLEICKATHAQRIIKGKSMVGEETGLNDALEAANLEVIESDLGEYIIQLAKEPPSHIIAPAIHKIRDQVSELFYQHHHLGKRDLNEINQLVDEARKIMRQQFLTADVGITGANLLVAETGSIVLVTNEGNGDLTATLPRVHIVIASIEKIVATLEDATAIIKLLAPSATGQPITAYTSFISGPKRSADPDGPDQFHVILLDNGRSQMLGNEFRDMLRCIRCGACLNHCPIYTAVGGHAYGWVYPGPMGAVLTPIMLGLKQAHHLPNASTLCGRCEEVCPMGIPIPNLLRHHRARERQQRVSPRRWRWGMNVYMHLIRRPRLYRIITSLIIPMLHKLSRKRGAFRSLLLANGWTKMRDFPAPENNTFQRQWQRRKTTNE